MRYSFLLFVGLIAFLSGVNAQVDTASLQTEDSTVRIDTPVVVDRTPVQEPLPPNPMADSFSMKPVKKVLGWDLNSKLPFGPQVLQHHPYLGYQGEPTIVRLANAKKQGKELLFYVMVGLLLVFSILRDAFGKYFNDLFRLFFRTTLKYRQIREQLMQTPLPSLLMNGFFVISGGLYISFLLIHYELIEPGDFWLYFFYACLGLTAIYLVKYVGLKIIGWIFNMQDAADSYIFIVFVINKVIGIFLLPFIVMLAFMSGTPYSIALVLSWFGIGALILYRFILSYAAVRNQVRFNPFHFFLYIVAFEIAPLLLIYKLLLIFFQ